MAGDCRRVSHRAVFPGSRLEFLRRSFGVVAATRFVVHTFFLSQLHQVSAVAVLSPDDPWPGAAGADAVRSLAVEVAEAAARLRAGATVLLPAAPAVDSRPRAARELSSLSRREVARCRVRVAGCVFVLAPGGRPALSRLPLVRRIQTNPSQRVVELSVAPAS